MKKWIPVILTAVMSCTATLPLTAGNIGDFISDVPGIGLVADEVSFDGITLRNLAFVSDKGDDAETIKDKYVITHPGAQHYVRAEYELDSEVLDNLKLHHFIYGLHNDGPQGCLLHTLGLTDGKGELEFSIQAPEEKGVYQLRFCHATGTGLFESVKEQWWRADKATSQTIMGIVVVK